ncbi:MAG: DEAD/DEAH box helicase [Acidobacteriaceae bacterium]
MELWPHQISAIQQLREGIRAGHRKQILMAPCGSGKTILACSMLQDALRKGSRAIFLVDRIVLVEQTSAVLDQFGLAHGVLQAGHWRMRPYEKLQVASAQTLERRGIPEDVDVLFVDEAHCLRKKFIDYLQDTDAVVVGLTATPFAKGLGKIYTRVVNSVTTDELIASGGLKPLKYYAATATIDTKGMKVVAGEWSESEIEERGRAIIGDVVQEWIDKTTLHFGGPRKTLVFSATVPHGAELCAKFREAGYDFRQISYRDGDDAQRAEIIAEFRRPDTQIHGLIACEIFTKGFDVPDVQVGVSARPYRKSLSSHIQQLGRVMRAYPGQEYGLWLDHSGNVMRFWSATQEVFAHGMQELDDGAHDAVVHKEPTEKEKDAIRCACGYILQPTDDVCPACGKVRRRRNLVEIAPGGMVEIDGTKANRTTDWEAKARFLGELKWYASGCGFAPGWISHKYREKFGVWPNDPRVHNAPQRAVTVETLNWIRSRNIAWAKSRRHA